MKILIAYDGSSPAAAALNDLRRAGIPPHAEAIVLSVADVWLPPKEHEPTDDSEPMRSLAVVRATTKAVGALAAARQFAEKGADIVRELFPAWEVRAEAVADSPAWATIKKASDWPADLIVVGSHGHSPINRLVFGSVSQKIVFEAPCSVRIGRKSKADNGTLRILAGVDGSADADATINAIAERAWPEGTEIRLMTAIDANIATAAAVPGGPVTTWLDDGDEDAYGWVSRMIDDASAKLRARGLLVSSRLLEGDPKQALLGEAESWGSDSIFVGARGHSLFERLLLGSVSSAVAVRAHCSVEVVRPVAQ